MFSAVWSGLHWGLSSEQTAGLLRVVHVSPQWPALFSTLLVHCLRSHLGGFILLTSRLALGSPVWALWTDQLAAGSFLYSQLRWRGERSAEPALQVGAGRADWTRQPGTAASETGFGTWFCITLQGVLFCFVFNFMESLSNITFECPSDSQWTGTLLGHDSAVPS